MCIGVACLVLCFHGVTLRRGAGCFHSVMLRRGEGVYSKCHNDLKCTKISLEMPPYTFSCLLYGIIFFIISIINNEPPFHIFFEVNEMGINESTWNDLICR